MTHPNFFELEEITAKDFCAQISTWEDRYRRINPTSKNIEVTYYDAQSKFLALAIITPDSKEIFYKET